MDEKKNDESLNPQFPGGAQGGGAPPAKSGKRNTLTGVLIAVIAVLAVALILFATPLRDVLFAGDSEPEITLELLGGVLPEKGADGLYRFYVEAKVKGKPTPVVTYNRNDIPGHQEANQTCVFLQTGETFTLVATAVNSIGWASATLELQASGDPENGDTTGSTGTGTTTPAANRPPVITAINFPSGPYYHGEQYTISVQASDPDGDPLNYQWEVSGTGTINNTTASSITWTIPGIPGGVTNLELVNGETGFMMKDEYVGKGLNVYAGDWHNNAMCRGFASFDTSKLVKSSTIKVTVRDNHGGEAVQSKTVDVVPRVHSAVLSLNNPDVQGDPSFMTHLFSGLNVVVVHWGTRPFQLSDYNSTGTLLLTTIFYNSDITLNSVLGGTDEKLAKALQKSIGERKERFQIMFHFHNENSNGDNQRDGVFFEQANIKLRIHH